MFVFLKDYGSTINYRRSLKYIRNIYKFMFCYKSISNSSSLLLQDNAGSAALFRFNKRIFAPTCKTFSLRQSHTVAFYMLRSVFCSGCCCMSHYRFCLLSLVSLLYFKLPPLPSFSYSSLLSFIPFSIIASSALCRPFSLCWSLVCAGLTQKGSRSAS